MNLLLACVKLALSAYTIRQGKRIDSGALIAVGRDCRNDCIVSVITILASLVFLVFHVSVDAYSSSVNIEVDHEKTIGEVYAVIHALQLKIMREFHIIMVFGMYAVDQDHEEVRQMREKIAAFLEGQEHVTGYHALYLDLENHDVYCDLVVDYELKDWDVLRKEFTAYMSRLYPENRLELVIETDYV